MALTIDEIESLVNEYIDDPSKASYIFTSATSDTHAVYSSMTGKVIRNSYVSKLGDITDENTRMLGRNAAIFTEMDGSVELVNSCVVSSAIGGDAFTIYDTGSGSINRSTIYTDKRISSAVLAVSDATVEVNNSNLLTKGEDSPTVYVSESSIDISNTTLASTTSPLLRIDNGYRVILNNIYTIGNPNNPEILINNGTSTEMVISGSTLNGKGSSIIKCNNISPINTIKLYGSTINSDNDEGYLAEFANSKTKLYISDCTINSRDKLVKATANSIVNLYIGCNTYGSIETDSEAKIIINIDNGATFYGNMNGNITVNMTNGFWENTGRSEIKELVMDDDSLISKNANSLFIDGIDYTEGIVVGSVVHYTYSSEKYYDRVIIEKNCIVIKILIEPDNTNRFIIYDADDHIAYKVTDTEFKNTGRTVDISPYLDDIEALLRDIERYFSGTTEKCKEDNTNAILIDAEEYNLDNMNVIKYGNGTSEARGLAGQNAAVKVTNTTGNITTPGILELSNSTIRSKGLYAQGTFVNNLSRISYNSVEIRTEFPNSEGIYADSGFANIIDTSISTDRSKGILLKNNSIIDTTTCEVTSKDQVVSIISNGNRYSDISSTLNSTDGKYLVDVTMRNTDTNNVLNFNRTTMGNNADASLESLFKVTGDSLYNTATINIDRGFLLNLTSADTEFFNIDPATVNINIINTDFRYYNRAAIGKFMTISNGSVVNYNIKDQTQLADFYSDPNGTLNISLDNSTLSARFYNTQSSDDSELNVNLKLTNNSKFILLRDTYIKSLILDDTSTIELGDYTLYVNGKIYTSNTDINNDYEEADVPTGRILKVIKSEDFRAIDILDREPNYIYFVYDKLQMYFNQSKFIDPFAIVDHVPENNNAKVPNMLYITLDGKLFIYTDYNLREVGHVEESSPGVIDQEQLDILSSAGTTYFHNAESRYIDPQTRTLHLPYQNGTYQISLTLPEDLVLNDNALIWYNANSGQWEVTGDKVVDPYIIPDIGKLKTANTYSALTQIMNNTTIKTDVRISPLKSNLILSLFNGLYANVKDFATQDQYNELYEAYIQYKKVVDRYMLELRDAVMNVTSTVSAATINEKIETTLTEYASTIDTMINNYDSMSGRLDNIENEVTVGLPLKINAAKDEIENYLNQITDAWVEAYPEIDIPNYTQAQYAEQAEALAYAREQLIVYAASAGEPFIVVSTLPDFGEGETIYAIYDLSNYRFDLYSYDTHTYSWGKIGTTDTYIPSPGYIANGPTVFSDSANVITTRYTSTAPNENAVQVKGEGTNVILRDIIVVKSGAATSIDNARTYGINASMLVKESGKLTISDSNISSTGVGATGIFCYGSITNSSEDADGSSISLNGITINTNALNADGIIVSGGGVITSINDNIRTNGNNSSAIRVESFGGTLSITDSNYSSYGNNASALYTNGGTVTINNSNISGFSSKAIEITNGGSIDISNNSVIYGSNLAFDGTIKVSNENGNEDSNISITDSTIYSSHGNIFYIENTNTTINLDNVSISNDDVVGALLYVYNDGLQEENSNIIFNIGNTNYSGSIIITNDTINITGEGEEPEEGGEEEPTPTSSHSNITITIANSTFRGTVKDYSMAPGTGEVSITIDSDSTIVLTDNTILSSITGEGSIYYGEYSLTIGEDTYNQENPYDGLTTLDKDPDAPDEPEPEEPDNPDNPDEPVEPENPEEPDNPNDPTNPDDEGGENQEPGSGDEPTNPDEPGGDDNGGENNEDPGNNNSKPDNPDTPDEGGDSSEDSGEEDPENNSNNNENSDESDNSEDDNTSNTEDEGTSEEEKSDDTEDNDNESGEG